MYCTIKQIYQLPPEPDGGYGSLKGMAFFENKVGWFTSDFAVFRTRDFGESWTECRPKSKSPRRGIVSAPSEHFCAVAAPYGPSPEYCYTRDGGETWASAQLPGVQSEIPDLQFLDESHGWLLSAARDSGQIYRTTDSGEHWDRLAVPFGEPRRLCFSNPKDGWMIVRGHRTRDPRYTFILDSGRGREVVEFGGEENWICRTSDGGATWNQVSLFGHDLVGITALELPSRRVYVTGIEGFLAVTDDGAQSWVEMETGLDQDLDRVASQGSTTVVPGIGGIAVTTNLGRNWSVIEVDDAVFSVCLWDDHSGVIGATRGIYRFNLST